MKHIDKKLTGKTNLGDERVIEFLAELERTSPAVNHAQEFDIAQVVPRWCDAILEPSIEGRRNPFNSSILRIEMHTMFITELATCARRSLFTKYCPRQPAPEPKMTPA